MIDGAGTVLSSITIQSLADLGYVVNVSQAEQFKLPDSTTRGQSSSEGSVTDNDISIGPIVTVDESGRMIRVIDD